MKNGNATDLLIKEMEAAKTLDELVKAIRAEVRRLEARSLDEPRYGFEQTYGFEHRN